MKKVIDGVDAGGITEAVRWKGGAAFRHYWLVPMGTVSKVLPRGLHVRQV
jgi:hypothetical protein